MYLTGVENLRREFPEAAFTTDILTGFPGETEEEYAQTRHMIEAVGFAKTMCSPIRAGKGPRRLPCPASCPTRRRNSVPGS